MRGLRFGITALVLAITSGALAAPGTEFWAVLSDDEVAVGEGDLSILIGNPDPTTPANVTVATETGVVDSAIVAPLSTHVFSLGTDRTVVATALVRLAYKIASDVPIHAYQFFNYQGAMNRSAALLIDRQVFGSRYLVLVQPGGTAWPQRTDYVTIIAPAPTQVTVTPKVATQAGSGVPALAAGESHSVDLDAFDVLQLAAQGAGDLTGTSVTATAPVEVFSECVYCRMKNSQGNGSANDHVQELMPPIDWWGTSIVATANNPLVTDINIWRILASEDATTVSTDPVMPGTPTTLDRGGFIQFESTGDFAVSASRPVLVGRYNNDTVGSPFCEASCPDPALALMTPPERFFKRAVFAMPPEAWKKYNILDIVARAGTLVSVDGVIVPAADFLPVGASGFSHAQVLLSSASTTRVLEADRPIGAYATETGSAMAASYPVDIASTPNLAPACDAGGPYVFPCSGPATGVSLNGTSSSDPENAQLSFRWSSSSPGVSFDDATSPMPVATEAGIGVFPVDLEVDDGSNKVSCSTTIQIGGDPSVPPELDGIGVPFLLVKQPGGIAFAWQDLGGAPMSYNIYEGTMQLIDSHAPLVCNVTGSASPPARRELTRTPSAGSLYFVMSAANCAAEGPSGMDEAQSTCPP